MCVKSNFKRTRFLLVRHSNLSVEFFRFYLKNKTKKNKKTKNNIVNNVRAARGRGLCSYIIYDNIIGRLQEHRGSRVRDATVRAAAATTTTAVRHWPAAILDRAPCSGGDGSRPAGRRAHPFTKIILNIFIRTTPATGSPPARLWENRVCASVLDTHIHTHIHTHTHTIYVTSAVVCPFSFSLSRRRAKFIVDFSARSFAAPSASSTFSFKYEITLRKKN